MTGTMLCTKYSSLLSRIYLQTHGGFRASLVQQVLFSQPISSCAISRKTGNLSSPSLCLPSELHSISKTSIRSFTEMSEKDFDKIPKRHPEKGTLVYVGSLTKTVRLVKGFSVSTSFLGLCAQPMIFKELGGLPFILKAFLGGGIGFFIFLTPLLLHWITKRYVTTMYFHRDREEFTVTTLSFFLRQKTMTFTSKEVTVPEIPGLFTSIKVNGKPLFTDPTLFLDKHAYFHLMKYDQPLDYPSASGKI